MNKRPKGYLGPKTEVPHQCNMAGRCCWGSYVNLTPFDVWRMLCAPNAPVRGWGVTFTWELREKGLVQMGVGPEKRMPLCMIQPVSYRQAEGAVTHCPFVVWDDALVSDEHAAQLLGGELPGPRFWTLEGRPRFRCGLGGTAPILCQFFPMARVGSPAKDNEPATWRFACPLDACEGCMPDTIKPAGFTVQKWLRDDTVREYLRMSQEHQEVLYAIQQFQLPDMMRRRLAATMFDFDQMLREAGVPEDQILAKRPKMPEHLTMAAKAAIIGMMQGGFGGPQAT